MARVLYYLGGAFRETGQALDRMGLTLASNPAFKEQCMAHFDPITVFCCKHSICLSVSYF